MSRPVLPRPRLSRFWQVGFGGEGGIRTPETSHPVCRISSAVHSTTLPPLLGLGRGGEWDRPAGVIEARRDYRQSPLVATSARRPRSSEAEAVSWHPGACASREFDCPMAP